MKNTIPLLLQKKYLTIFFLVIASFAFAKIEAYFSDVDPIIDHLIEKIDQEKKQIDIAVYTFTHQKVIDALKKAQNKGVQVRLFLDPFSWKIAQKKIEPLLKEKVEIYIFDESKRSKPSFYRYKPLLHHKFVLFYENVRNKPYLWTGSFNLTFGASQVNLENVLLIDDKTIFEKYKNYYNSILNTYGQKKTIQIAETKIGN